MEEEGTGHVCWWAKTYSLVAKMKAIEIEVEAQKAYNANYDEEPFIAKAKEMWRIVAELEKI